MNELQTWSQEFFGTNDMEEARKILDEHQEEYPGPVQAEYVKMSFPYYAPDPSLPPLPTPEELEEIRASDQKKNEKGYRFCGNIFRVNDVYAVKYLKATTPMLLQVF